MKINSNAETNKVNASLNRIKASPRKISIIARMLHGMKVGEALNQLRFSKTRAAYILLKLLKSGIANAEHNNNINPDSLIVEKVDVGAAASLRRFHARARGRAGAIKRRYSNIRIHLQVKN
jgi:large subunit ribosomal protein L22